MKKLLCAIALALSSAGAYAQPNLVAHWPFTNGSLTDVIKGWTGTIVGSPLSVVAGRTQPNGALRFNHFTSGYSYIRVPHNPAMDLTSWTITAVVKPIELPNTTCQTQAIVWRGNDATGNPNTNHYSLLFGEYPYDNSCTQFNPLHPVLYAGAAVNNPPSPGTPAASVWLGTAGNPPNPEPLAVPGVTNWYCVTAMYDGVTGDFRLYIDGTLHVSTNWPNQYGSPPQPADLIIGSDGVIGSNVFTGVIDDIKIYDGIFTDPLEIEMLCYECPQMELIAHWNFDNNMNEQVNAWPFTVNGAPAYVNGMNGQPNTALKFNAGDYIQLPSQPAMDLTSWTMIAKVRADNFYTNECQSNAILWRGTQYGTAHYSMQFNDNAYDNTCFGFNPNHQNFGAEPAGNASYPLSNWLGTTPPGNPNPPIQIGQWYCVIASYDAQLEEMNLWIDGVHVFKDHMPNVYNYVPANAFDMFIGKSDMASHPYFFDGAIDDLQLYKGAICDEDITGLCCTEPPLIGHWDFNGGNLDDVSPHNWVSTIHGTFTSVNGANGAANTAIQFNGSSWLEVPSHPDMNLQSWSIEAVVKPQGFNANDCQVSSILWRGNQYSPFHYSMFYTDNPYDNDNCNANNPKRNVFCANPAGNGPTPGSFWQGTTPPGNPNPLIHPNEWYCVTATYNGINHMLRLYVDGVLRVEVPWNNQYEDRFVEDLFIGASGNTGPFQYLLNGSIDDLKLWGGVLDPNCLCQEFRGNHHKPTAIKEAKTGKITIIPNPASSTVEITIPTGWNDVNYIMTNTVGITVKKGPINGSASIDVSTLPAGLYIITTMHNGQMATHKLMVQH